MSCSRSWEMRAIDEGRLAPSDIAAFERHARACSICLRELETAEDLRTLTRRLPSPRDPSELEVRRLRARVLRDAMSAVPPRRARFAMVAFGLAAVAAAALLLSLRTSRTRPEATVNEPFGAVVLPAPLARWKQSREGRVERVDLGDGDLRLHVRKQATGERFIVTVPDGEVEVRGTIFEVSVHDGRTARVHVDDGVVVVRVHGQLTLSAGETWSPPDRDDPSPKPDGPLPAPAPPAAPVAAAPAVLPVLALPRPIPRVAGRPTGDANGASPVHEPARSDDGEMVDYERAIDAYRLGRFERAAELLDAFLIEHPASPMVDDASFIEASSSASAGRADLAARLAERHIARFPASFHRKDASILVARARRDHDDCAGARTVLAPWLGDSRSDPAVTSALGRCANGP